MDVITRPRKAGKTQDLVAWVKEGQEIRLYPGWTRIILTLHESDAMRIRQAYDLEYRQVFSLRDWQEGRISAGWEVEVAVDNADEMLRSLIRHGHLTRVTFTDE